MNKFKIVPNTRQLINQAWIRNGDLTVTGEALILACLLHTKGGGRNTEDMKQLQALMNDQNLDKD